MNAKKSLCFFISVMLTSCAYQNKNDNKSYEWFFRDNSGIYSQISISSHKSNDDQQYKSNKLNYEEQKGIWLSYIDLNEKLFQKSEDEFCEAFEGICQNCKAIGVNTLYIHCRAFGDAFYNSGLFQKTKTFGDIDYDPLEIMVRIAHENKLSVHAWINPLRCETTRYLESADSSFMITKWYLNGDDRLKFISSDEHYWLDPAYEDVRELICNGVEEIIKKYDVDGIHFDDYFYPTDDNSFDKESFLQSAENDLKAWRTENINKLVASVYKTIKEYDENILFGISPQGNIDNNYDHMYADVGKWCSEDGFIDYIVPQIYFGFENSILPFESCSDEWDRLVTNKKVKLIIGLAAYKIHSEDEFIEKADILSLQIMSSKKLKHYSGYAYYNYISLFPSDSSKAAAAQKQLENIKKTGGD